MNSSQASPEATSRGVSGVIFIVTSNYSMAAISLQYRQMSMIPPSEVGLFFFLPQFRQHAVILKRRCIADSFLSRGDILEQAAHDLAAAGLGQSGGKANVIRLGQRADFAPHMPLE